MQIQEVTTQDQFALNTKKFTHPEQILQYLLSKGYKVEGEGTYSVVLKKNEAHYDKIVKFNYTPDGCHEKFLQFAQANPNPHLPKVHSKVQYISQGNEYTVSNGDSLFVAVIERLANLPEYHSALKSYLAKFSTMTHIVQAFYVYSHIVEEEHMIEELVDYWLIGSKNALRFDEFNGVLGENGVIEDHKVYAVLRNNVSVYAAKLVKVHKNILSLMNDSNLECSYDLGAFGGIYNMMYRPSDGIFVFNDPITTK